MKINHDSFIKLRKGIMEHLEQGRINGREFSVYSAIHFWADYRYGFAWQMSAPFIARFLHENVSIVKRCLSTLSSKGYIKRFNHRGQRSYYPILIDKYEIQKGVFTVADKTLNSDSLCIRVDFKCTLSVLQMNFNCPLSELQVSPIKEVNNIRIEEIKNKENNDFKSVYDYYLTKDLKRHKTYTDGMRDSISTFLKRTKLDIKDCFEVIDRHKVVYEEKKNNEYPLKMRGLDTLFGQRVNGGKQLIAEQYIPGGEYYDFKPKPRRRSI